MTREQFISKVEATQKNLRRFLVALCCGDHSLADDLAQETYIKAYLSLSDFNNIEKFGSWIIKIGYNTFLNHKRGEKITYDYNKATTIRSKYRSDSSFDYQSLYQALDKLSLKERTSILLYYMQNYSIKEIAEIEGITADAVKQHLSRGRFHLRKLLSRE